MEVKHEGVVIEYEEESNRWIFTLRGRERFAESLLKAKEAIDKPPGKEKSEAPFERVAVRISDRYRGYDSKGDAFQKATVTSIAADANYSGSFDYWVSIAKGGRSKMRPDDIYLDTDENVVLFDAINALNRKSAAIEEERAATFRKLKRMPTIKRGE